MRVNDLKIYRQRKKIQRGRGIGSARGAKSGRGQKGQKSRSGGRQRLGFEGGHTTLLKKIPKLRGVGYKNPRPRTARFFNVEVNLDRLAKHFKAGELVTPKSLRERGLIKISRGGAKIIGAGKIGAWRFRNVSYSQSAKDAIIKAGGKIEIVGSPAAAKKPVPAKIPAKKK